MANLKMQKEIIELGKLFVKELKLDRGSHSFPKWVSFYIAEKIKIAEKTKGAEKKKAQDECFDAILKLWKHRWYQPHGRRPLENFEPLLNFIQKLIPEHDDPYFFPTIPTEFRGNKKNEPEAGSTEFWIEIAEQIDKVARLWLFDIMRFAAQAAMEGQNTDWLINSVHVPDNDDRRVIQYVLHEDKLEKKDSIDEILSEIDSKRKYDIEKNKNRIDLLERYNNLNAVLIQYHKDELERLEKLDKIMSKKPAQKTPKKNSTIKKNTPKKTVVKKSTPKKTAPKKKK